MFDDLLGTAITPGLALRQVLGRRLPDKVGAVVRNRALRAGREYGRQADRSDFQRARNEVQRPDRAHQRR